MAHRIDTTGHVGNQFSGGDPMIPRPPTQVDDSWLNMVQEEIVNAILATGQALVKGTNTQLQKALGLLGSGTNAGGGQRWFSGRHTIDVTTGDAITGVTSSASTADAGVTGASELATGVNGSTSDGIAGKFDCYGTGKALQANGPCELNGSVLISGVVRNEIRLEVLPGLPPTVGAVEGAIVYVGGSTHRAYCFNGTTWNALW